MKTEYTNTATALLAWLKNKGFIPGSRIPSARALAGKLDCTLSTANRACLWLIAQGKLRRDGQKLFVCHPTLALSISASLPIYVASPDVGFLRACGQILSHRGYDFRPVEIPLTDIQSVTRRVMDLAHRPRAGMIVAPWTNDQEAVNCLRSLRGPLVVCNDLEWDEDFNVVGLDLQRGVEKALRYLIAQGHHELAHVSCSRKGGSDQKLAINYRNTCLALGLRSSAARIWQVHRPHSQLLKQIIVAKRKEHPEVSALFGDDRVGMAATEIFSIPDELSFVGFYDLNDAAKTKPLLTTLALQDPGGLAFWCCLELISLLEGQSNPLHSSVKRQIKVVPNLIVRGSTKNLGSPNKSFSASRVQRVLALGSWDNIYPFIKKQAKPFWSQVDLRSYANHSLTRPHGWLGGLPLLHLLPGLRSIHGVPFQIMNESQNNGRAAITFASPRTHTALKRQLPVKVRFPVKTPARAVYFLHGCGWAQCVTFASYTLFLRNGKREVVNLTPMGPGEDLLSKRDRNLIPNLQDWWPDFVQRRFTHAQPVLITDPSNPHHYERYIYSLECILETGKEIQTIEVSVDPKAGPTLALLAISILS